MDDGPFIAKQTTTFLKIPETSERFKLSKNGELILTNRSETLSPLLTLVEDGKIKWTLDTDVRNTEGFESCRIWKISNIEITKNTNPIELTFIGYWTYGAERGRMEKNSFCLSW